MSGCKNEEWRVLGRINAQGTALIFGEIEAVLAASASVGFDGKLWLAVVGITPTQECLNTIAGSKFRKDVVQMEVDRRVAYPKLVRNFLVEKSFRQEGHDLIFA